MAPKLNIVGSTFEDVGSIANVGNGSGAEINVDDSSFKRVGTLLFERDIKETGLPLDGIPPEELLLLLKEIQASKPADAPQAKAVITATKAERWISGTESVAKLVDSIQKLAASDHLTSLIDWVSKLAK